MTESEAKKILERILSVKILVGNEITALSMAIDALEEIYRFRSIGVVSAEELQEDLLSYKADQICLEAYTSIGTIGELLEQKEKIKEKKVIKWEYLNDGIYIICPHCNKVSQFDENSKFHFCPQCGGRLDLSEVWLFND